MAWRLRCWQGAGRFRVLCFSCSDGQEWPVKKVGRMFRYPVQKHHTHNLCHDMRGDSIAFGFESCGTQLVPIRCIVDFANKQSVDFANKQSSKRSTVHTKYCCVSFILMLSTALWERSCIAQVAIIPSRCGRKSQLEVHRMQLLS